MVGESGQRFKSGTGRDEEMTDLELQLKLSLIHAQLSQLRQEIRDVGTPDQQFIALGKVQCANLLMVEASCGLGGMALPPYLSEMSMEEVKQ